MTDQRLQDAPSYDNPDLYNTSSGLRQRADAQWVMSLLPDRKFRRCLDVGCGNGTFLAELVQSGRVLKQAVAMDRSKSMVETASLILHPLSNHIDVCVKQADALTFPTFKGNFDLITMNAVLHWLYPDESKVFSWLAGLIESNGIISLTTYHPKLDRYLCGGTDILVIEAMKRIRVPNKFPEGFNTMGRRTRPADELALLLKESFVITNVFKRRAITRATDAKQYSNYHVATFGSYYSRLISPDLEPRFIQILGEVAMDHMRHRGYVTSMDVRLWTCQSLRTPPQTNQFFFNGNQKVNTN